MKTNNGGQYPNILKVVDETIVYTVGTGVIHLVVEREVNDSVLIMEIGRYAMETYGAVIANVFQTDYDVEAATQNTDHVTVVFWITEVK